MSAAAKAAAEVVAAAAARKARQAAQELLAEKAKQEEEMRSKKTTKRLTAEFLHEIGRHYHQRPLVRSVLKKKNLCLDSSTEEWIMQRTARWDKLAAASGLPDPWDIKGAMLLEREPFCTPSLSPWQQQMKDFRFNFDNYWAKPVPPGLEEVLDIVNSASEVEEIRKKMNGGSEVFPPEDFRYNIPPRWTVDDESGDRTSIYRQTGSRLYLVVKKKRDRFGWQFPQKKWHPSEHLYDTAVRGISRCGPAIKYQRTPTFPVGVFHYQYPENQISVGGIRMGHKK